MDAAAIQRSWAKVQTLGDAAAQEFYAVLFAMDPGLRSMFPVAMSGQRDRLFGALGRVVSGLADPGSVVELAQQLGRDHRRFEVEPRHYPIVGRALLTTLERGLGPEWTPELAAGWSAAYDLLASIMIDAARESAETEPAWWNARVISVHRPAADVAVLSVQPDRPYPYIAGQSIAVESALRPREWRYFSPANAPRADGLLEFHIKAVPGGMVSSSLVYQVRAGDQLRMGAPVGTALTGYRTSTRPLLMLAGGTGMAPMRAVAEQIGNDIATRRINPRQVVLVVGARSPSELYDYDALADLAQQGRGWLTIVAAVSDLTAGWRGARGTAVDVALSHSDWFGHDIYVCGSPDMVNGTRAQLLAAGHRPETIQTEAYGLPSSSQPIAVPASRAARPEVVGS